MGGVTNKSQGNERERASRNLYEEQGCCVIRSKNVKSIPDLIVLSHVADGTRGVFGVEVKSTIHSKWRALPRDKIQYGCIKEWSEKNAIPILYHIWTKQDNHWKLSLLPLKWLEKKT